MKRFTLLALLVTLAVSACSDQTAVMAPDGPQYGITPFAPISVLSQNLYLGANIDPLITPGGDLTAELQAALIELNRTYFPARAQRLAMEIAARQPQVVGLQEVSRYDFIGASQPPALDFLDVLQAYLTALDLPYDIAVHQHNVELTLPTSATTAVKYTDGDAILVRRGVAWKDPAKGHYSSQVTLQVAGTTFTNLRGWNAVTVRLNNWWYRFFNTHLEIQAFKSVQEQQATELAGMVRNQPLATILVGDFNSAANDDPPTGSDTDSYEILENAGFADLWTLQTNSTEGLTCCQAADLSNATSELNQRLDIVFVHNANGRILAQSTLAVFGDKTTDIFTFDPPGPTPAYTLWPSDHAGVFAQMSFGPALANK